jgi:anti-sigma B factor antagonist
MTWRQDGSVTLIDLHGDIDCHAAPEIRGNIRDLVGSGHHHFVVHLDSVEFLDSSGLGVLVSALRRARAQNGSLRLVCANERLLALFRITGLTEVFEIHPDSGGAVAAARQQCAPVPSAGPPGSVS